MPMRSAIRRASLTLSSEQQGLSGTSAPSLCSFMVAPTTSYPSRTSMAAATDESTPPDIATSTRGFTCRSTVGAASIGVRQSARLERQRREHFRDTVDARVGRERTEAHADGGTRDFLPDAKRLEPV